MEGDEERRTLDLIKGDGSEEPERWWMANHKRAGRCRRIRGKWECDKVKRQSREVVG